MDETLCPGLYGLWHTLALGEACNLPASQVHLLHSRTWLLGYLGVQVPTYLDTACSFFLPTRCVRKHEEEKDRSCNFPLARQITKCLLLHWLPLTPMWIQHLKFSRPHDQYSGQ